MQIVTHDENCTGPNPKCKKAARNGRTVHLYPDGDVTLVLPTYHFESVESGTKQIEQWAIDAVRVKTDDDLYAARNAHLPYILPKGWIDPSRR